MDKEDVACMHIMEHYLARKKEGNLANGDNMHLEGTMLSEIRQRKTNTTGILYKWNLKGKESLTLTNGVEK